MLKVSKYFIFFGVLFLILSQGCNDKNPQPPDEPPEPNDELSAYKNVNDWILEMMEVYYYWNKNIPEKTNKWLKPNEYFKSLLYKDDRFSWIQDNYLELLASLSGVNTEAGYDYNLLLLCKDCAEVIGYITYIKPGSPAASADLKRGDFFLEINGKQMTQDNINSLLGEEASMPHTIGIAEFSGNNVKVSKTVSVSVDVIEENPILLDTIYHIQDKKIGYFVYNFFAPGLEDVEYELELNDVFGKFNEEPIDELIVDLRYNGGGAVSTAISLASMISGKTSNDVFGYYEFNSLLDNYYKREEGINYNVMNFVNDVISYDKNDKPIVHAQLNKLSGLNRVYFIVSFRTASASELVINCIRPYMGNNNVILIGMQTVGKNCGSFSIYESDPVKRQTNKWGMQPIVMKLSNSQRFSDFTDGFIPDIDISEWEDDDIKPLGDIDELLLATTIDDIFGIPRPKRANVGKRIEFIGSAIDKTPARENMYIIPHDRKIDLYRRD